MEYCGKANEAKEQTKEASAKERIEVEVLRKL